MFLFNLVHSYIISIYPSAGITAILMKIHIGGSYSNLSKLFDFG